MHVFVLASMLWFFHVLGCFHVFQGTHHALLFFIWGGWSFDLHYSLSQVHNFRFVRGISCILANIISLIRYVGIQTSKSLNPCWMYFSYILYFIVFKGIILIFFSNENSKLYISPYSKELHLCFKEIDVYLSLDFSGLYLPIFVDIRWAEVCVGQPYGSDAPCPEGFINWCFKPTLCQSSCMS